MHLVFTGKASTPKILAPDAQGGGACGKNQGAIAYISADATTSDGKVLEVK